MIHPKSRGSTAHRVNEGGPAGHRRRCRSFSSHGRACKVVREVFVGVDASTKFDSTGIAVVSFDRNTQMLRLCTHRIFQPTPDQPLDFELTIEAYCST